MIFYFSGTGNSLHIAGSIAKHFNEKLVSVADAVNDTVDRCEYKYALKDNELIGFIYPVYAWAPPKMVLQFIERLTFENYHNQYVFTVATCGTNIGNTMKIIKNRLSKRNLPLNSGFSIAMPSNYMLSSDLEPEEVRERKLSAAEKELDVIYAVIANREMNVFKVEKGRFPFILTGMINPLFNKMAIDAKRFYTNDKCTKCGLCERICNCRNISVKEKPYWGKNCSQCLACINYCPSKAIQYGKGTEGRRRYVNPCVSMEDMTAKGGKL